MREPPQLIVEAWNAAATGLGRSFSQYWPSDPDGANDPAEANVTVHFGAELLNRGMAVFAEAQYPKSANVEQNRQSLDLLAICPGGSFFLAAEFKRLIDADGPWPVACDFDRLSGFRINERMPEDWCNAETLRALLDGAQGWGLVGGLAFARQDRGAWLDTWRGATLRPGLAEFMKRIRERDGRLLEPLKICDYESTGGSYHLLGAIIPL